MYSYNKYDDLIITKYEPAPIPPDKLVDDGFIKVKGYLSGVLFPKLPAVLGKNSEYGITKWEIDSVISGRENITLNKNREITVKGNFFEEVKRGRLYTIFAKYTDDDVYGPFYSLMYINEEFAMGDRKQEKYFLSSILTSLQIKSLYETLADPFEAIKTHDVEALTKAHGIGKIIAGKIIDRYEANKDYSKLYVELTKYEFTPLFIQKLISTYRNPNKVIEVIKNNPYQLIYDVDGIGFKRADEIALKGGMSPKSQERLKAYIIYFLTTKAEEDGDSWVTAGETLVNIYTFFGGANEILEEYHDEDGNLVDTNINMAMTTLQNEKVITIEDNENKSRRRIYLSKYYILEKKIAANIQRLLNSENSFKYAEWEEDVKALEQRQGFDFDETQKAGIKLGLDSQVCFITGLGGTGKSTLVSGILSSLGNYNYAQCALSGKAASRLQEVTGQSGQTIHRLLGYTADGYFFYNKENKLPYDIIILDELSLVGGEIFLKLIEAIKDGAKLIMLGDLGQLESIGSLNLAHDFYQSDEIPTVELTTVHRQAAMSGIITSAHTVRYQQQLFDSSFTGNKIIGELKDMLLMVTNEISETREKVIEAFKNAYNGKVAKRDIMKIQVIAPIKERGDACVYNLNNDIQDIVNPLSPSDDYIECGVGSKKHRIHVGDKVMCIKNKYDTLDLYDRPCPIFNGWVGKVSEIFEDGSVVVDFPLAGGDVLIRRKDAPNILTLGYVSTVHKCQGSDYPVIIGCLDYATPPAMLTAPLLYTLITRAKKRCIIVAQNGAMRKAITTNTVPQKRTFMQEFLEEEYSDDIMDKLYTINK